MLSKRISFLPSDKTDALPHQPQGDLPPIKGHLHTLELQMVKICNAKLEADLAAAKQLIQSLQSQLAALQSKSTRDDETIAQLTTPPPTPPTPSDSQSSTSSAICLIM